ncbi:MAG: DUF72 domain-containing protein [Planctomycetes bacterium]|nr:DUF72 domain-containing protein [Planctomycetota bacterium]
MGRVLVGVAGWSYPDWKRIVYPPGCRDPLRLVAGLVGLIEIDSSFYRTPALEHVAGWAERTRDLGTRFTAKLPQDVTHRGDRDPRAAMAFLAAFEPLRDAGRLDAFLAQFSYRFEAGADALACLRFVATAFGRDTPLLLEVRHASWRDRSAQARAAELGFRLVDLDYPGAASGFAAPLVRSRELACLRVHGRNRDAWFDREAGRDATYDYLYSAAEVDELTARIDMLAKAVETVHVVANNHFRGQAVKLALELRARITGHNVDVPATLLEAFPSLAAIARRAQGGLFGG